MSSHTVFAGCLCKACVTLSQLSTRTAPATFPKRANSQRHYTKAQRMPAAGISCHATLLTQLCAFLTLSHATALSAHCQRCNTGIWWLGLLCLQDVDPRHRHCTGSDATHFHDHRVARTSMWRPWLLWRPRLLAQHAEVQSQLTGRGSAISIGCALGADPRSTTFPARKGTLMGIPPIEPCALGLGPGSRTD